jgi:penicillin-insensitive murein endopeptidase
MVFILEVLSTCIAASGAVPTSMQPTADAFGKGAVPASIQPIADAFGKGAVPASMQPIADVVGKGAALASVGADSTSSSDTGNNERAGAQSETASVAGPDARKLFAEEKYPANLPPRTTAIGTANCGCIAGAKALPLDGPGWQVMRPSRNRYWGHPDMIDYVEQLGARAAKVGWTGLLVGDMGMPRGGPMPFGHASHQRGTDVDIWLTKGPDHTLPRDVRESLSALSVLKVDSVELDPEVWTPAHANFVREAAKDDRVARIFVTPAIKKYMCSCKAPGGADTEWLRRLRPWEGHDDHIHVRLKCPKFDPCIEQDPPPEGDGCGAELDEWMQKIAKDPPHKSQPQVENEPNPPLPLSKMPPECQELLKMKPEK